MENDTQREMTLREWCQRLPKTHLVNRELNALEREKDELEGKLREAEKILNQVTQSTAYKQCREAERIAKNLAKPKGEPC